jgi:hypothetical protein
MRRARQSGAFPRIHRGARPERGLAKKIPKEDADTWLSPGDVLNLVRRVHGANAEAIILDKLRAGFLLGICSQWSDVHEGDEPAIFDTLTEIPASFWTRLKNEDVFWTTGDARFFWYDPIVPSRTVRCSCIRFMARQIEEAFPGSAREPEPIPPASSPITEQPLIDADARDPVSGAAIRGWAELFKRVYSGTRQDTLAFAWKSAQGMFPDKLVTRDNVRKQFEGESRKRGPKPSAPAK